ncbi:hypothetical protein VNI00_009571 [Paramarasmius palmivorus]|uniref:Gustatory receptor n=1 Tax=Paramarasmius palmivorus TaxID=297713 RepID=A0AAW0CNR2_9AGAR
MDNLSHSDSITKIIAVIQIAWFLLQVGARAVEGLAITELEIITVGFAVLNFGTYFLWWNKPLRVRHPVRVYWRQQAPVSADTTRKVKHTKIRDRVWANVVRFWTSIWDEIKKVGKSMVALFNFLRVEEVDDWLNQEIILKTDWIALLQLVGLPFLVVWRLIIASIFIIVDSNSKNGMAFVVNSSRLKEESFTLYILVYGLTTLFSAIHCIPWNFQFPTHTEQLLWRISAGGLVVLPIGLAVILVIFGIIIALVEDRGGNTDFLGNVFMAFDAVLLPIAYFVARVILMVLALMELRHLPPSAYQTVEWTTFIPHIG